MTTKGLHQQIRNRTNQDYCRQKAVLNYPLKIIIGQRDNNQPGCRRILSSLLNAL